jgi:hypothetical protein
MLADRLVTAPGDVLEPANGLGNVGKFFLDVLRAVLRSCTRSLTLPAPDPTHSRAQTADVNLDASFIRLRRSRLPSNSSQPLLHSLRLRNNVNVLHARGGAYHVVIATRNTLASNIIFLSRVHAPCRCSAVTVPYSPRRCTAALTFRSDARPHRAMCSPRRCPRACARRSLLPHHCNRFSRRRPIVRTSYTTLV